MVPAPHPFFIELLSSIFKFEQMYGTNGLLSVASSASMG